MRPTRCQLRYSRLSAVLSHGLKAFGASARALPSRRSRIVKYWSPQSPPSWERIPPEAAGSVSTLVVARVAKLHLARIELATFSV